MNLSFYPDDGRDPPIDKASNDFKANCMRKNRAEFALKRSGFWRDASAIGENVI